MILPDKKITGFIRKHHVLTLSTVSGERPWCSNMFYAYLPEANLFVFTSDDRTRHIGEARANPEVAASIVLETKTIGRLQGLQIGGRIRRLENGEKALRNAYLKRFPYAAATELNLWIIEPYYYKFTDNTLGFGKKLVWQRAETAQ